MPIFSAGFSEPIGSWKTTASSVPRNLLRSVGESLASSRPASVTEPVTLPGHGMSCESAMAVIVLPLPDSPTIASFSPLAIENETPRTTSTGPLAPGNVTTRSRTTTAASLLSVIPVPLLRSSPVAALKPGIHGSSVGMSAIASTAPAPAIDNIGSIAPTDASTLLIDALSARRRRPVCSVHNRGFMVRASASPR